MNRPDIAVLVAHGIPTVGLFLQGLVYVTSERFMPYHADALATTWEALPANYQGFLIGVIKAMGAGSIGVTFALFIMMIVPFRRGERWARWAIPVVGVMFTGLTAYAAYTIDARTPASPPWRQTLAMTALYLVGAAISYWPAHNHPGRRGMSRA